MELAQEGDHGLWRHALLLKASLQLNKRRLNRGAPRSIVDLQADIIHFLRETNNDPKPFT